MWLITSRRRTGRPRVDYEEAVEEALCFGWIDSKGNNLDDERSMLWLAPSASRARGWSRLNKERVAKLMEAGLMTPAGLAKVEAARRDGSWYALDGDRSAGNPARPRRGAERQRDGPAALRCFPPSAKRALLGWIAAAKRPETRAKRIAETVESAAQNIRANQWPRAGGAGGERAV